MKLIKIFLYILSLNIILLGLRFLSNIKDLYILFSLGSSKYSIFYIISLTAIFVLPLFLYNKIKNIYLSTIFSLCIFINFILLTLHADYYFYSFLKYIKIVTFISVNYLLISIININIIIIFILFYTIQHLRQFTLKIDKIFYLLYLISLFFFALISNCWYFSTKFATANPFFKIIYYSYINFKYIIYNLIKQDLVIYMSIILLYLFWNNFLFQEPNKEFTNKRKKKTYILLWLIFGQLGLERLYLKTKYKLINFQVTSSVIINYLIFNLKQIQTYNILLLVIIIILLIIKLYYFITSFYYSLKYELINQD